MKKILSLVLLALIGFATISSATAQKVTLRLQPVQGQTNTVTSKANMTTKMEVQGQTMSMMQTMETKQSFVAKEVTGTKSVFETQVESIKMSISQMGMKFDYDSEHPEKTSPLIADQTKELENTLKKPATFTYDAMGRIIDDSNDTETSPLSAIVLQLPEQELTVGSKWNSQTTQNVNGTDITVNMEYTVTNISKKSVEVSYKGAIESTEITGNYDGTASINSSTGLITSGTTKSTISMTVSEQGLTIPMTVSGTTTIDVK